MFAKNKTILYITKSKLKISSVDLVKLTENIISEVNWTAQTLDDILLKLKKEIGDNARILLSEELVYTITMPLSSEIPLRDNIRQIAQEFIPENLNETIWDFKRVLPNLVQVVAVNKALFAPFDSSIVKTGLSIEAIEPLSIALARFSRNKDTPSFYVYIDNEVFFILALKDVVLATERVTNINVIAINQFIAFAKEKFNIEQKEVIFCGNTRGIDMNQFMNQSFKIEVQNINPLMSLAAKEDIKGKDEEVLNLELSKPLSPVASQNKAVSESPKLQPVVKKPKFSKTTLLAILLILAIVILVALIIFKVYV